MDGWMHFINKMYFILIFYKNELWCFIKKSMSILKNKNTKSDIKLKSKISIIKIKYFMYIYIYSSKFIDLFIYNILYKML